MKTCSKCASSLPLSEFYRNSKGGHCSKCKSCTRRDVQANRILKHEKYTAFDRERAKRPERKALFLSAQRRRRQKHPEKTRAHNMVSRAVRKGTLVRGPCEVCGTRENIHGHHDDYAKPLEVRWFCQKHHRMHEHGSFGSMATAGAKLVDELGPVKLRDRKGGDLRELPAHMGLLPRDFPEVSR